MKNVKLWVLDQYLRFSILSDFILGIGVLGILYLLESYLFDFANSNQENNYLYLISSNVSLAGFVIAALTIIITFKANTAYKKVEEFTKGTDLIFNTAIYPLIIKVFVKAIFEFIVVVLLLFLINVFSQRIDAYTLASLFIGFLTISLLTTFRVIAVLFYIIKSQIKSEEQ